MGQMEQRVRPGGLTVLSILNFIFGGLRSLGVLFSLFAFSCITSSSAVDAGKDISVSILILVLNTCIAGLMIASGVGYLLVKRVSGRWLGNGFIILELIKVIIEFAFVKDLSRDFSIFTMISLIYPILSFILINIVFRDIWRDRHRLFTLEKGEKADRKGKAAPHFLLISTNSIRQTIRGGAGILFSMTTLILGLFIVQIIILPIELFEKQTRNKSFEVSRAALVEEFENMAVPVLRYLLGETGDKVEGVPEVFGEYKDGWAYFLLKEKPGVLSLIFLIFCIFIPLLIAFGVFNQISGDAKNLGFRYILLRTRRKYIYFGKFLASFCITVVLLAFLVFSAAMYVHLRLGLYFLKDVIFWSLRSFLLFIVLSLPYTAFCLGISGLIDSSFGSLAASVGLIGLFPVLVNLIENIWSPFGLVQYLLPHKVSFYLFHYQGWTVVLAFCGCILYTGIYLYAGYYYFSRRNL